MSPSRLRGRGVYWFRVKQYPSVAKRAPRRVVHYRSKTYRVLYKTGYILACLALIVVLVLVVLGKVIIAIGEEADEK